MGAVVVQRRALEPEVQRLRTKPVLVLAPESTIGAHLSDCCTLYLFCNSEFNYTCGVRGGGPL